MIDEKLQEDATYYLAMAGLGGEAAREALEKLGYFSAPASKSHHLAEPGGLLRHSVHVTAWLERLTKAGVATWEREESPYLIGMLHDLVKCKCYAAAMREALEQLSDKVCDYLQKGLIQLPLPIEGLLKQARDALAAPARQCDVGTAEEQFERWQAFCGKYDDDCTGCPCDGNICTFAYCFAKWAQMPYEEGGADADKS